MSSCAHGPEAPCAWVCRWAALIRPRGRVLDVACGHGRHVRYLSSLGLAVVGVDRDGAALAALQGIDGVEIRSEEHTSELQSPCNLVCRLLLEKKKNNKNR